MSGGVLSGPLAATVARRLLAGRTSRLLSSTARAALVATTLGVAALGVAMALLTGYREDLVRKLVGGSAAILVYATDEAEPEGAAERIASVPGVVGVDRVAFLTGVVAAGEREAEVTVRGAAGGDGPFSAPPERLARGADGAWGAVVGHELGERLGVRPGDALRLTVLSFGAAGPRFAFRTLRVAGTFQSGFSEFDRGWVVVAREALAGAPGGASAIWEVRVDDPAHAEKLAEEVRDRLGPGFLALDWRELNRELFAALELQQRALFLLLGLIVLVATFNVASTLVVLVRERRRDFGVLAALGLSPARLRAIFLLVGLGLGAVGTAAGLALAFVLSEITTRFELLRFDPAMAEIYFLRSVPLRLSGADALAIAALALGVTVVSSWLPARRAARLDPAAALRYE
ncbi:MAG TPA: FtsX-like permease family protein [Thermoanaerobaculia bacterium]|nr:FtsX-like permease family protein [Thermoanaerobaculia bacterium]